MFFLFDSKSDPNLFKARVLPIIRRERYTPYFATNSIFDDVKFGLDGREDSFQFIYYFDSKLLGHVEGMTALLSWGSTSLFASSICFITTARYWRSSSSILSCSGVRMTARV